jgi:hypothetical protein
MVEALMSMAVRMAKEQPSVSRPSSVKATDEPEIKEYGEDDVIYPSLLDGLEDDDILNKIDDPEWVDILTLAAYGDLPGGFTVRNAGITFNQSGKRKSIRPSMDPTKAVNEIRTLFQTVGGIRTELDIMKSHRELMDMKKRREDALKSMSWSTLKPKTRIGLVQNFVKSTTKKLGLSVDERNYLLTCINVGLSNSSIAPSDFQFENGEISSINSLFYDGNTFHVTGKRKRLDIKDTKPDSEYFNMNGGKPTSNTKFSGIHGDWEKVNNLIMKSVKHRSISTSRSSIRNSLAGDSSIRKSKRPILHYTDNADVIASLKPDAYRCNPDNVLLSPRPLTFWDRMDRSRRPQTGSQR